MTIAFMKLIQILFITYVMAGAVWIRAQEASKAKPEPLQRDQVQPQQDKQASQESARPEGETQKKTRRALSEEQRKARSQKLQEQKQLNAQMTEKFKATIRGMKPTTVALEIDGQTATWRELYPHIQSQIEILQKSNSQDLRSTIESIRENMQKLVSRRMFAMEAQRRNLIPNADERAEIEKEIAQNLEASNGKEKTLEQFISSCEMQEPNLINASYDDIVNIMFLNKKLFSNIQITDQEIDLYIRYKKGVTRGIDGLNKKRLEAMNIIAKAPALKTEEGFKKIAMEFSEGTEAVRGGIIDETFSRQELAEVNEIEEFNWKEGEVTPVLETSTAYRIMKILQVIPPQKPGEPEQLRVAQILCGKIGETEDLSDKETIRANLTMQKQKATIDLFAFQLSQELNVKTPLFPDGLWDKNQKSAFADMSALEQRKKTDK